VVPRRCCAPRAARKSPSSEFVCCVGIQYQFSLSVGSRFLHPKSKGVQKWRLRLSSRMPASPVVISALDMILDHMPQISLVVVHPASMMAAGLAEVSIRTLCPVRGGPEFQRGSTQPLLATAATQSPGCCHAAQQVWLCCWEMGRHRPAANTGTYRD